MIFGESVAVGDEVALQEIEAVCSERRVGHAIALSGDAAKTRDHLGGAALVTV